MFYDPQHGPGTLFHSFIILHKPLGGLNFPEHGKLQSQIQPTCVFCQCHLIDSRWQTAPANAKACWWMAPAPPQRKSIEVMGRDGLLKLLHMAVCLGRGARRKGLPTICVQRGTAKHQSLFTLSLNKTHTVSKLNMSVPDRVFGRFQHHYALIQSVVLLWNFSVH